MYWGTEIPDPCLKFRGTAICAGFIHWMISYTEGMAWYSIRYADDTQIYNTFLYKDENDMINAKHQMEDCLLEILHWMNNKLRLNQDKTELLISQGTWFCTTWHGQWYYYPIKVKEYRCYIDSTRSLFSRIGLICKSMFFSSEEHCWKNSEILIF